MEARRLEVADVFREHFEEFCSRSGAVASSIRKVASAIMTCRSAALGGHLYRCIACEQDFPCYNSCRNRHCPKCLGGKIAKWLKARAEELLPVPYFHVVFTLPHLFNDLTLQNKRIIYGLLFQAASQTLLELAADEKYLGAEIGFFGILHSWTQRLLLHPHVHFVVAAAGFSKDRTKFLLCKRTRQGKWFFVPVPVIRKLFRGKFLALLKRSYKKRQLHLSGSLEPLNNPAAFEALLKRAWKLKWCVYCKEPFATPSIILKYLSRYTHRIACSNKRLLKLEDGKVTFLYKDRSDNSKKTESIKALDFIARFMLHVVPQNFYRIRYYGFMANNKRSQSIALARTLLAQQGNGSAQDAPQQAEPDDSAELLCCPHCGAGDFKVLSKIASIRPLSAPVPLLDSS